MLSRGAFVVAFCLFSTLTAHADTFGSGENAFEIPFVTIGDPGNAADTTGDPNPVGSVGYVYRIGKYEVPEEAIRKANAASESAGDPLGITIEDRGPQKPATRVSWFEAAKFVNWLNTEKGATPAYKFDASGDFQLWSSTDAGYDPENPFRNSLAFYFLPSVDEWYKAAFYDPEVSGYWDYPNGSDSPPLPVASGTAPNTAVYQDQGQPANVRQAGGLSPLLTVGQAGNVWEWEETEVDLVNDDPTAVRGFRGGDWSTGGGGPPESLSSGFRHFVWAPGSSVGDIGFRVASRAPEPGGSMLVAALLTPRIILRKYRRSSS